MRRFICALIFVCWVMIPVFVFGQGAETEDRLYTLDQLYGISLTQSETVQMLKARLFVANQQREAAKSALIPKFSAMGNYQRYSRKKIRNDAVVQPEWSAYWGGRLDQRFTLNGREFIALEAADHNIAKSRYELDAARETFLYSVAGAFYGVLRAERRLSIAETNMKRLEKYLASVETRLKLEAVTKTALFRAKADLSSAEANRARTVNRHKLALANLGSLAGLKKIKGVVHARVPENVISKERFDLDVLKQTAMKNRGDILAAEEAALLSEKYIRIEKSAYWPTISLEGVYMNYEQGPSGSLLLEDSLWLGANINIPIFDGGLRKANIAEANAVYYQAVLQKSRLEKEILLEVESAYYDYTAQKEAIGALSDQLEFSRENFAAVTRQFENGLADSLDVLDANTLLVTGEEELADAVFALELARLSIDRARGTLLKNVEQRLLEGN